MDLLFFFEDGLHMEEFLIWSLWFYFSQIFNILHMYF